MNTPIRGWALCSQLVGALALDQEPATKVVLHYYDGTAGTSLCSLFTRPHAPGVMQANALPVPSNACPWCADRVRTKLIHFQEYVRQDLDPEGVERRLDELRIYVLRHPPTYQARARAQGRSVILEIHNGEETTVATHPDYTTARAHADRINEAIGLTRRDL